MRQENKVPKIKIKILVVGKYSMLLDVLIAEEHELQKMILQK